MQMQKTDATGNDRSPAVEIVRYRQTPHATRLHLAMLFEDRIYKKHRQAVLTARPTIDNTAPRICVHKTLNLNRLQNVESRLVQMERDNAVLLSKMSYLYRKFSYFKEESRGVLDVIKSMGKHRLQREFLQITAENQAILQELHNADTVYSRVKFLDQYENWKKSVVLNSRYPVTWDKKGVPHYTPPAIPYSRCLQTRLTPLKPKRHRRCRRTRPGGDIAKPGGDVAKPGGGVAKPGGDVAKPGCDVAKPVGDVTKRGGDVAKPGGDVAKPGEVGPNSNSHMIAKGESTEKPVECDDRLRHATKH